MKRHRRTWPWFVVLLCGVVALTSLGQARAVPRDPFDPPPAARASAGFASRWHAAPSRGVAALALARRTMASGTTASVPAASAVTVDRRTRTLYAAGGDDQGRLFVLDLRGCTAHRARCRAPLASVPIGAEPVDIAVDPGSGTVYVSQFAETGTGTVAVVDGRHCNARDVSGCGAPVTQLEVGGHATGLQLDRRTHTLYVGSIEGALSVVDTRACNATHPAGCTGPLLHAKTGTNPAFPSLDPTTDTLYVPQNAFDDSDRVDVVDARTCNASDSSGCSRAPATFPVGNGAAFAVVDHRTGTLYVSNQDGNGIRTGTVSVVDARRCNARTTTGCPTAPPPTALIGPDASNLVVDARTHSLYGLSSDADILSIVDTRSCQARDTSGCGRYPRTVQTGIAPLWMTSDRRTRSLYLADHGADAVQVLDPSRCSAVRTTGCRRTPPVAPATSNTRVIPAVHTIYQAENFDSASDHHLTFLDTRTCNVTRHDCVVRASVDVGYYPQLYVDPGSSTLYLVDTDQQVVHLVDARSCNVSRQTGCAPFADVPVPAVTGLDINPRTHTVYADQDGATTIAVLPGAHCNALDHTRCGPVHEAELGGGAGVSAFDVGRDTVYVATSADQGTLTLLPSAACDAGSPTCTAVGRTRVAGSPIGQQVVPRLHSLYVTGSFDADVLSVVDTAACNAHHVSGCAATWPTTPTPHDPFGLEYDPQADRVVVTSWDSNLTVLDPNRCSAVTTAGCARGWPRVPVGFRPVYFAMDPRHDTLYTYNFYDQTVSLVHLARPCRPHLCVGPPTLPG